MLSASLTALLALLPATIHVAASPTSGASQCRCLFGDPCWPSDSDFSELAAKVSQPLIHPAPPAQPCYTSGANSSECEEITSQWFVGNWRANQTGAMESTNFETFALPNRTIEACYLNTTLGAPCGQGRVPVIGVDARSVEDIQTALNFSVTHNLRLVVKNTGHGYLGRSNGRGSFMVWTHNLKNITVHPTFSPEGAPANETYDFAITLGSGVQWHEAYAAANDAGRVMVGGASDGGSVGAAGGWLGGGGHSALAPSFGLGVDHAVEITAVTSNGTYLVTNAHQNSDLFWALRGGGGGTYAVVTSVTYRTHPSFPVIAGFVTASINGSTPNVALSQVFTELVRITPELKDAGWGGYSSWAPSANGTVDFQLVYVVPADDEDAAQRANATLTSYIKYVKDVAANSTQSGDPADVLALTDARTQAFPAWHDWYTKIFSGSGGVAFNVEMGSWLLPRDVLQDDHEQVADALLGLPGATWYLVTPGGAAANVSDSAAGIHPAWRKAAVHTVHAVVWPEGATLDEIDQLRDVLKNSTAKVRALAPESGAYFNEASLYEPDFKKAFFGSHYDQLRAIKATYDPIDLLVVAEGVGSDEWDESLTCRK